MNLLVIDESTCCQVRRSHRGNLLMVFSDYRGFKHVYAYHNGSSGNNCYFQSLELTDEVVDPFRLLRQR